VYWLFLHLLAERNMFLVVDDEEQVVDVVTNILK